MKRNYESTFKTAFPKATIESHKGTGPLGKRYYLVRRERNAYMWSGSGNTKAQAWEKACINERIPL